MPARARLVVSAAIAVAACVCGFSTAAGAHRAAGASVRPCGATAVTRLLGIGMLWASPDVSCDFARQIDKPAEICDWDPAHVGSQTTTCTDAGFNCTLDHELDSMLTRCLRGVSIVEVAFGDLTPPDAPATQHAAYVLPPENGAAPFPACPFAGVIGSRGSGENQGSSDASDWDLGLGPPSLAFALALGRQLPDVQYTSNPPPGYPAVTASTVVTNKKKYIASVDSGEHQLLQMVEAEAAACPTTNIILSGYSQGAELAGDALIAAQGKKAIAKRIWGVVLFGDPLYNHNDVGADYYGDGHLTQNGILTERHTPWYVAPPHAYPKPADHLVMSFCISKDPICQGIRGNSPTNGEHQRYVTAGDPAKAVIFFIQH